MKWYEFLIKFWSQISVLITVITGCTAYILNMFWTNRDKRRNKRYDLFQEKKINAVVKANSNLFEFYSSIGAFPVKDLNDEQYKAQQKDFGIKLEELRKAFDPLQNLLGDLYSYVDNKVLQEYIKIIATSNFLVAFISSYAGSGKCDQKEFNNLRDEFMNRLDVIRTFTRVYYRD